MTKTEHSSSGEPRLSPPLALWQISSVLEYLIDRGEVEDIQRVTSRRVRYDVKRPIKHVDLMVNGSRVRLTATLLGS